METLLKLKAEIDTLSKKLKALKLEDRKAIESSIHNIINQMKLSIDAVPARNIIVFGEKITDLNYILNKDVKYLEYLSPKTAQAEIERAIQNVKFFTRSNLDVIANLINEQ